jgi:hypothetical protein
VDKPDFPLGPLRPGTTLTVKFFALYELNEADLIQSLKLMKWPTNYGTTNPPRLGADEGQKAAFLGYISAINNAAFDTFPQFYHPDVTLHLPSFGEIKGRDGVVAFFKPMFELVREKLEVTRLIADDDGICAEMISTFVAVQDAPKFFIKPLKKGETVTVQLITMYELKDGLIYRMQATRKQ